MLQVTARIFDNNQLVGYQLKNGREIAEVNKLEAWNYAKKKVSA